MPTKPQAKTAEPTHEYRVREPFYVHLTVRNGENVTTKTYGPGEECELSAAQYEDHAHKLEPVAAAAAAE
jgi:hypothetical protein